MRRILIVLTLVLSTTLIAEERQRSCAGEDVLRLAGRLVEGGEPVSGVYEFELTPYPSPQGGEKLVSITTDRFRVVDGSFAVAVNAGTGIDRCRAEWLSVALRRVDGSFIELFPRLAIDDSGDVRLTSPDGRLVIEPAVHVADTSASSPMRLDIAGQMRFDGKVKTGHSLTINGADHTITATTVTGFPFSKQIHIGYLDPANPGPFSDIRVGIGTKTPGQKMTIFDPTVPALEITSGPATLQLAVATFAGSYSNVATTGDTVIRADGNATQDLILAIRNGNNGAIRFTTTTSGNETEKMILTSNGSLGIGTAAPPALLSVGGNNGLRVDGTGNLIGIRNVTYSWPAAQGAANTVLTNNGTGTLAWMPSAGGGVGGTCSGANMLPKWSSPSALTCSQVFDNGTNVGIGTTTPASRLEVRHQDLAAGANVLRLTNDGAGTSFTETGIAFNVGLNGNPSFHAARIYAKYDGTSVAQGRLTLQSRNGAGQFDDTLSVKGTSVGIGTINPDTNAKLHVAGKLRVDTLNPAGGTPVCRDASNTLSPCPPSDARLKTKIQPLGSVLDKLEGIRGITFEWSDDSRDIVAPTGRREIGVLAQEVAAVYPELVTDTPEGYKSVDYARLSAVLIEAVKELKNENTSLAQRLAAIERRND